MLKASKSRKITRRETLKRLAMGGGALLVGAGAAGRVADAAPARPAFDWQRFKGQSIYILFPKHPWCTVVQEAIPEFEKLTGIKVVYEDIPEQQARQKTMVEFASGSTSIDLLATSMHVERRRFAKAGWYFPLDDFLKDPNLTSPDLDWDDFTGVAKKYVTVDGKVIAVPGLTDCFMMAYLKDALASKGIKPPQNLVELEAAAKALHNPPAMMGFLARGLKNANTPGWYSFHMLMGGQRLERDAKVFATDAGVKSMEYYARLVRQYGPPGVVNMNWYEITSLFAQGGGAMVIDGLNFATQYENKEKSKVVGKVGYAPHPVGPAGPFYGVSFIGMSIPPFTKKKEPAWFFAQWAASKEMSVRVRLKAGTNAARKSEWDDPRVKSAQKMPPDWVEAGRISMGDKGELWLPNIIPITEWRDIFGVAIVKVIEGGDAKAAIDAAIREFQPILDKSEA
jgi:multiple sugar transport system substrate-binding protein